MSGHQPRSPRTGRFEEKTNTPAEVRLALPTLALTSEEHRVVLPTLRQLSTLFTHVEAISKAGLEEFFREDFIHRNAAVGSLIRLGERAKRLPKRFTDAHPEPGYSAMARQRDFLAHHDDRVDWSVIWRTITEHVPAAADAHEIARARYDAWVDS